MTELELVKLERNSIAKESALVADYLIEVCEILEKLKLDEKIRPEIKDYIERYKAISRLFIKL